MTTEIQWRRRWRPGLTARPWQPFSCKGDQYLLKSNFVDSAYEIMVAEQDFKNVWYERLETEDLKKRNKKLNPSIEAPIGKLLDHIRENVENQKKGVEYSLTVKDENESKMMLTVNTKLAGLPFVWKFMANSASSDMVMTHLRVPLLGMVGELLRRQTELYKLLKNKDKEIDDLKSQGTKVSRKHLETPIFNETVFQDNMLVSKGFTDQVSELGQSAFSAAGQDLYKQVMTKHSWIHRDPRQELEGESLPEDAGETGGATSGVGPSWGDRVPHSLAGSPRKAPNTSPGKSPAKTPSPAKSAKSASPSPAKNIEELRKEALKRKLDEEMARKEQKAKKKKKIAF